MMSGLTAKGQVMTASQTIKKCGLKSTKQVADLNGVTPRTIQLAYRNNRRDFYAYVIVAVEELHKEAYSQVVAVMDNDINNPL